MSVLQAKHVQVNIEDLHASKPDTAELLRFPGSPTVRIDGRDIDPGFTDPGDVVIAHGRSKENALKNALRVANDSARRDLISTMKAAFAGQAVTSNK